MEEINQSSVFDVALDLLHVNSVFVSVCNLFGFRDFYENISKCFPKYLAPNVSFEEYDEFPFRGLLEQGMAFVNFLLVWIFPLERQGVENYFGLSELILREFLPFAMRLFHEKFY